MLKLIGTMNISKKTKYLLIYTLSFVLCCLAIFYVYYSNGLSFIYDGDGWSQHYKAYIYYGEYLRTIIKNIFVEHSFVIPQWNFSIGEGYGILETFNYYVIGDPIAFLTVFIPSEYMYIFYDFAIILRLYLSGLFFSLLCFYVKKNNYYAVLGGSLTYVFCFWAIFNSNRHPYFLNPMVYLPLVIMGVEKIINNDKPYLFAISVCISALSNFYFFYNIVLLTVIYVVVRLLTKYKNDFKTIFNKVLIIFKYAVLALLMSAVIVLPVINVFLNDTRASASANYNLLYPIKYYLKLFSSYVSVTRNYWLCMGYAAPTLLAFLIVFKNFKKNLLIVILDVLAIIFVLFPVFGQIFNGFSYVSNKWCFGLSLLVSYNLVEEWDEIKNNKKLLLLTYGLFTLVCIVLKANTNILVPIITGFVFLLVSSIEIKSKVLKQSILVLLIAINVCFNGIWEYSTLGVNYSSCATNKEDDKNIRQLSEAYYISQFDDEDFYRYSGSSLTENSSLLADTHSTQYYWSLTNSSISNYRSLMQVQEYSLYHYQGYDQRCILNTLANVKYYVTNKDSEEMLPYNFEYYKTEGDYDFYINNSYLPFGYTYENAISYDEWYKLSAVEKEEALTKAIVLDNGQDNIALETNKLDYTITDYENVEFVDNKIIVSESGAYVTIEFNGLVNSSLYFSVEDADFIDDTDWLHGGNSIGNITIATDSGISKNIEVTNADNRYYNGRNDFTVYLGYYEDAQNSLTIYFGNSGEYSFGDIFVSNLPMENYEENINNLSREVLDNVIFEDNTVSGNISLKENKYLLLSIPYSKGWKAYVDGEQVELLQANEIYCALSLETGNHTIELKYETPFLKLGAIISVAGIAILVADALFLKKKQITNK